MKEKNTKKTAKEGGLETKFAGLDTFGKLAVESAPDQVVKDLQKLKKKG